jgi:hypothetical protein
LIRKVFKVKSNYEVRVGDREKHGDTYEKYCHRCQVIGVEPQSFNTWLLFELNVTLRRHKPGPSAHLDAYQQLQA